MTAGSIDFNPVTFTLILDRSLLVFLLIALIAATSLSTPLIRTLLPSDWWHTDGVNGGDGIPVRDEAEEMESLIQIIHDMGDAYEGLPVHLVIGNDYGKFMAKIMEELSVMRQSDAT
jgi:hypothetical protein